MGLFETEYSCASLPAALISVDDTFLLPRGFDSALLEASVMVREKLQALRSKTEAWLNRSVCHSAPQIPL